MPDPIPPEAPPPAAPPVVAPAAAAAAAAAAVSPTGEAVIPQILTRVALAVFGVAGAIALAPTAGVDVSFLPPLVPKVCALVAFVAATMGFMGTGLRKKAE
jgi:hypothetical protein